MDDFPDRLEPFKTLHETRANDQYGKLPVLGPSTMTNTDISGSIGV